MSLNVPFLFLNGICWVQFPIVSKLSSTTKQFKACGAICCIAMDLQRSLNMQIKNVLKENVSQLEIFKQ